MKRTAIIVIILISVIVLFGGLIWAAKYFAYVVPDKTQPGEKVEVTTNGTSGTNTQDQNVKFIVETVAENLFVPWSIVFTSPTRMLITERSGNIRVVENGILRDQPLLTFENVSQQAEEGLMGMVLDPDYATNKFLYVCVAFEDSNGLTDHAIRLRDDGTKIVQDKILLDGIPAAQFHAGCRLGIGPDKKLYITTGEATQKEIAQDLHSLGGKILRINLDGTIPSDNPFADSPVYTFGHRNPQGIAWQPETGVLISTEHGPSIIDGQAGGDEINRIEPGKNYGWPLVSHDETGPGLTSPLIQFTPAVAPASAMFYSGDKFPAWRNKLFFGALVGEGILNVTFTDNTASTIAAYEQLDIPVGRVRDVVQGPDGFIYFSTSNRDGRGLERAGDDHIYRLVPAK